MSIFAGTEGFLDDMPVKEVPRFETGSWPSSATSKPELRAALDREKKMTDQIATDLKAALDGVQGQALPYQRQHGRAGVSAGPESDQHRERSGSPPVGDPARN